MSNKLEIVSPLRLPSPLILMSPSWVLINLIQLRILKTLYPLWLLSYATLSTEVCDGGNSLMEEIL